MSTSTLIPHLRQVSKKALPKISSLPSTLLLTRTPSPILISKRALTSTALKGLSVVPSVNPLRQYSTPSLVIQNEKTNVNQGMAYFFFNKVIFFFGLLLLLLLLNEVLNDFFFSF